jgi:hypothetical protein
MSEHKSEANDTGRAAADKAGDKASSPSRRRALKAALAATPLIMSIKSRPAFAVSDGTPGNGNTLNNGVNTQQTTSSSLSTNMSAQLRKAR